MTNFFDQLADRQLTGAQKVVERRQARVQSRREEKMRPPSALEQKRLDDAILHKLYRAWKRELRQDIVHRHGRDFAVLLRLIRNLSWKDAPKVVEYIHDAWWLRRADEHTRLATLGYIDDSMIRARIRQGLPPFDDGLPGEPASPMIKIRRLLMGF